MFTVPSIHSPVASQVRSSGPAGSTWLQRRSMYSAGAPVTASTKSAVVDGGVHQGGTDLQAQLRLVPCTRDAEGDAHEERPPPHAP